MPNKFIEKLAVDLAISCEGNTTRTQRIENALKILTSYRDEILKGIGEEERYNPAKISLIEYEAFVKARTEIIDKIKQL